MQNRMNKLDMLTYESDYVVAEFNRLAPRNVWLVYEDIRAHRNDGSGFSIGLRAPHQTVDPAQTVRLYVPIFEGQEFVTNRIDRLAGIALPKDEAADFRGYYRITDQQEFKLLPVMWLSSDRRSTPLYQRIGLPGAPINPRMPPFDSWDCPAGNP
jgi:hypothetical protein